MIDNRKLSELTDNILRGRVTDEIVGNIINNYRDYPLYIIKYLFTHHHRVSSLISIKHIISTKEKKCELMDCILQSHGVKVCNILSIKSVCNDNCQCYSRRYWRELYTYLMDEVENNNRIFTHNFNVYTALNNLISKTDVCDDRLLRFVKKISEDPKNWKLVIRFINVAELYGSTYGDIIFNIKDMVVKNDNLPQDKRDYDISKFDGKILLINTLKKYNKVNYNISKITNNLYITDIEGVKNISAIRDKKIDCIVTLTKKSIFHAAGFEYIHIEIDDIATVDFVGMTNEKADLINRYIKEDNKIILVHCYKGISRSVSFVTLILIKQGMSVKDALNLIKEKRSSANPNPAFIKQIINYVNKINNK